MSELTFNKLNNIQGLARAISYTIDALAILPKYDANLELIQSYENRLGKLIAEIREELK